MVIGYAIKYLLVTCAASTALAIVLPEEPHLIRIPMTKQYDSPKGLQRKRDTKLYNDYGSIYLVDVAVGTPPQVFELAVDTGSSDLWIPGSQCPDSLCPLVKFNEANSTTYKPTSENFNIKYGTGNATGKYALDTITIAGATIEEQQFGYVSATNNILTEVTSLSGDEVTTTNETIASDSYYHMNGIFGLGFPFLTASATSYNPFLFNLKALNKISQNIFSIYMNQQEVYGDSGEIILGGIDKTKYTGEIIYVPVSKTIRERSSIQTTDYGFWQVNGQGVGVANGVTADVKLDFQETVNLIFDTGFTYSRLPTNVFEFLLVASIGENNFSYNPGDYFPLVYCSVAKQNTTIQIMMSQSTDSTTEPVTMHIPLSDILIPLTTSTTICGFGIVPVESRYVIGESLLRSLYQVYDAEKKRIGVAGAISSTAFVTSGKVDSNNIGGKNIGRSYL
ncbi:aspartic peptidase domain-containing protein [Mucor mucedo]|uniref:aspartic peptidase domain-containing protein n=1 Tax=Mucor mucedo TaxID=29922 RepID=UPI00222003CB|nr:aspartic peptidase domain-containing protein [Mucor mucedo]KAI7896405.1 aspartic peptidase domain-containing protein [Mucor mucedo]